MCVAITTTTSSGKREMEEEDEDWENVVVTKTEKLALVDDGRMIQQAVIFEEAEEIAVKEVPISKCKEEKITTSGGGCKHAPSSPCTAECRPSSSSSPPSPPVAPAEVGDQVQVTSLLPRSVFDGLKHIQRDGKDAKLTEYERAAVLQYTQKLELEVQEVKQVLASRVPYMGEEDDTIWDDDMLLTAFNGPSRYIQDELAQYFGSPDNPATRRIIEQCKSRERDTSSRNRKGKNNKKKRNKR